MRMLGTLDYLIHKKSSQSNQEAKDLKNKKLLNIFQKVWFGFMAYQPLLVIQCPNHFCTYKQFCFKLFSLA